MFAVHPCAFRVLSFLSTGVVESVRFDNIGRSVVCVGLFASVIAVLASAPVVASSAFIWVLGDGSDVVGFSRL